MGCLSLRSSQSQRLFLKPAIPLSPGEEPARTNRSAGAREVCFISILETRSWASLCLSFLTQRTGGFVLWCPISSLCFLPLSPYDPSYPFPQAIPDKSCLSRGTHWAVVCADFSRVLSVAPTSEAPWLPCLSQGWGSGRGTAAPGFPRGL